MSEITLSIEEYDKLRLDSLVLNRFKYLFEDTIIEQVINDCKSKEEIENINIKVVANKKLNIFPAYSIEVLIPFDTHKVWFYEYLK